MKIGVMFGSPETTTGGNALKFYASVRLDIRRTGSIKKGEEVIGSETKVKVVKNKVSPPFKTAEFDILYGEGISREGEIIDMGVAARVLEKSGAWYAYNGEKIGQGKDNAREYLRENLDLAVEIENKVREAMAGQTFAAPSGFTLKMDEKNHHLHKSVFIGEIKADGQFNVVWKTPGPVKAKPWSPYIEGNDKKPDQPAKK
jgi:recombination protein RecA